MNMDRRADEANPTAGSNPRPEPSRPVVVPSAEVLAIVRHAEPPLTAPTLLAPYVVRVGSEYADWLLTDDVVAFATPTVIPGFAEWRSSWERVWVLDPVSSLSRLVVLIRELDPGNGLEAMLDQYVAGDDDLVIPLDTQPDVMAQLDRIAGLIRERDSHGFGIIDRTPGNERVGLARAWPASGGEELIADDGQTEIRFQPDIGLVIATGVGSDRAVVASVDDVRLDGSTYIVTGPACMTSIDATRAHSLAWLMPGSTDWRVRHIPEILAWARTFGGLEEAHEYASGLGLPLRLTRHRPIVPPSVVSDPS